MHSFGVCNLFWFDILAIVMPRSAVLPDVRHTMPALVFALSYAGILTCKRVALQGLQSNELPDGPLSAWGLQQ